MAKGKNENKTESKAQQTHQVAIVTGGTRGIGAEISRALISQGYTVVAFYAGHEDTAKAFIQETGHFAMKVDVTDGVACEAAVHNIDKK